MTNTNLCPCCSQIAYESCCKPYIEDNIAAPTAEALMRSRYVAYTTRNNEYLLATWHESTRPTDTTPADDSADWIGLQILRTENGSTKDTEGVVEFRARCRINEVAGGVDEASKFIKENDRWYYVDGGSVQPIRTRHARVGRNDPCPCGSGKKYKKCCAIAA